MNICSLCEMELQNLWQKIEIVHPILDHTEGGRVCIT